MYFFYGKYPWSTKKYEKGLDGKRKPTEDVIREKPLLFFFHKKLISGRSRFSKNIQVYFAKFIEAFKNSAGAWKTFLTDKGVGSPPMEYNILIEDGLRYVASCVCVVCVLYEHFLSRVRSSCDCYLCMGISALKSREFWSRVKRFRKTERYIAVSRHCLQLSADYKQWDCFSFADYQNRQALIKTFEKRHFPLSNGEDETNFGGEYNYEWNSESKPAIVKPDPDAPNPNPNPTSGVTTVSDPNPTPPKMIFDVDLGELVPFQYS